MSREYQSEIGNRKSEIPDWLLACFQMALGHELPNQLVASQGLLRLLEMEEADHLTDTGRDYLKRLLRTAQRTHFLIHSLAEIVRALRSAEPAQPLSLAELTRELAAEVKQLFADRTIGFHFDILEANLSAPPRALRQMVVHLFRSAICLAGEGEPQIEVKASRFPTGVEFQVRVRGQPLSPLERQQLLEPFAGSVGGSDHRLGLFLVRALVDRWGGSMIVSSEPSSGNTFTLKFPAGEGSGAAQSQGGGTRAGDP
jgi:signal transduction histidine kinase